MPDKLYKINYKPDQNVETTTLDIYAAYSDLAQVAKELSTGTVGSETQPVYFEDGVPHTGVNLSNFSSVKYTYDDKTAMATITFGNWKDN